MNLVSEEFPFFTVQCPATSEKQWIAHMSATFEQLHTVSWWKK